MGNSKVNKKNAKNKSDVWYKVLAIVIGVVLLFGLGVAIMQPTGIMDFITLHTQIAMKTENFSVNNAQFMYLTHLTYNNYYQTIYESYGSTYLSAFGLDLESVEVVVNAGNDIGNARRPVHTAMLFPAECVRLGAEIPENVRHDIPFQLLCARLLRRRDGCRSR